MKTGTITKCSIGIVIVLTAASMSFKSTENKAASDRIASQNAFLQVYKVFMSPRCMNCHPAGDVPLNGNDHHLHPQGVKRGEDGKGLYALKCANCHQSQNTPGLNMPPGVPDWHLPPADMKMVFQGKTAHELALQIKDPNQNGGKSLQDLVAHMKTDLVKWAWNPGDGRTKPPLSYNEFYNQFKLWIDKGAVVPN
jgi:mono/diheme cytochrome c family protein